LPYRERQLQPGGAPALVQLGLRVPVTVRENLDSDVAGKL
jgi:hypothetical protein